MGTASSLHRYLNPSDLDLLQSIVTASGLVYSKKRACGQAGRAARAGGAYGVLRGHFLQSSTLKILGRSQLPYLLACPEMIKTSGELSAPARRTRCVGCLVHMWRAVAPQQGGDF